MKNFPVIPVNVEFASHPHGDGLYLLLVLDRVHGHVRPVSGRAYTSVKYDGGTVSNTERAEPIFLRGLVSSGRLPHTWIKECNQALKRQV